MLLTSCFASYVDLDLSLLVDSLSCVLFSVDQSACTLLDYAKLLNIFLKRELLHFFADCHKAFALVVRPPTEQTNLLFSFQMTTEEPPKENWLKVLCRHVANTICKADAVS